MECIYNKDLFLGSMVKWITLRPCLGSSDNDTKLCTSFEFYEVRIYTLKKKHIDLQSQENYDDKRNSKKSLHVLEDGASGCARR